MLILPAKFLLSHMQEFPSQVAEVDGQQSMKF